MRTIIVSILICVSSAWSQSLSISGFWSLPEKTIGISGHTNSSGLGFYADFRTSLKKDNFYAIAPKHSDTHQVIKSDFDRIAMNMGVTSKSLFFAIGFEYRKTLFELNDPNNLLGNSNGEYWIESDRKATIKPNLVFGILQRWTGPLGWRIGGNFLNKSLDLGAIIFF